MKIISVLLLLIFVTVSNVKANVAQPGIWNAGGMGNFSLLYPDDSLAYRKIQMVDERVSIHLYQGYAVVKGIYKMFNDTKDTVKIKTGYPLNAGFKSETNDKHRAEIRFDSLYGLDVFINQIPVKIISEPSENKSGNSYNDNWYVWENTFPPGDTTNITVYFIVSTNNSFIRKGYSKDEFNGFIYILETGSTWKQPILNGELRIKTEGGIKIKDIKGIKPDSVFKISETNNLLQYKFSGITPVDEDNIIVTYSENKEELNFADVLLKKEILYRSIDDFSELEINISGLVNKKFESPYEVQSGDWGSVILIFSLIGIPVLVIIVIVIVLVILLIWFIKRVKREDK